MRSRSASNGIGRRGKSKHAEYWHRRLANPKPHPAVAPRLPNRFILIVPMLTHGANCYRRSATPRPFHAHHPPAAEPRQQLAPCVSMGTPEQNESPSRGAATHPADASPSLSQTILADRVARENGRLLLSAEDCIEGFRGPHSAQQQRHSCSICASSLISMFMRWFTSLYYSTIISR
ncbi:hypothetical protein Pla100_36310 [Neorhodopirellula pilleata]|uniref:Uncharacterized protein n=1 Tax=Neorhodopirellula pilleata TaxID=2714738 RepID=A0A5C6A509_9BACT|nr:hypothetical protein Pla100_36310 [Neorhodopirellula pilleata]